MLSLAYDRSVSSPLRYDVDGRLHCEAAVISAASVDGYLGAEIPGYRALGLDPSRTYQLLRGPDELRPKYRSV
jgi:hypothetical protein